MNGRQTWYVRDASGNVMSVCTAGDASVNNGDLTRTETNLYGSTRLRMSTLYTNVQNIAAPVTTNMPGLGTGINITFTRGEKFFELSNHLGNVLATVSDAKKAVSTDGGTIDHYEANITSAQDYYPFGMLMPGRNGHKVAGGWSTGSSNVNGYTVPESLALNSRSDNQPGEYVASETIRFAEGFRSGDDDAFNATIADDSYAGGTTGTGAGSGSSEALRGYRYGFNGKGNDNEVKGEGNQIDYGMRVHDPRIGRFLSVDPLTKSYPWYTPYQFAGNTPIQAVDVDGREVDIVWFTMKYIEWVYGDPTGVKTLKAGLEQKAAIESRRTAYHNNDVPVNVQAKLDKINTQVANAQILIGAAKLVKFNIETSFETTSMIVPVEEGIALTGRGLLILAGTKVETRVLSRFGRNVGERAVFKGGGTLHFEHQGMEFLDDGARMVEQPLGETTSLATGSTTPSATESVVDLVDFRRDHILNRHRARAGKPGKTEFPSSWSNERIINEVNMGTVDGVEIRVDFYPPNHPNAGRVSTAYPVNTTPNPN